MGRGKMQRLVAMVEGTEEISCPQIDRACTQGLALAVPSITILAAGSAVATSGDALSLFQANYSKEITSLKNKAEHLDRLSFDIRTVNGMLNRRKRFAGMFEQKLYSPLAHLIMGQLHRRKGRGELSSNQFLVIKPHHGDITGNGKAQCTQGIIGSHRHEI